MREWERRETRACFELFCCFAVGCCGLLLVASTTNNTTLPTPTRPLLYLSILQFVTLVEAAECNYDV